MTFPHDIDLVWLVIFSKNMKLAKRSREDFGQQQYATKAAMKEMTPLTNPSRRLVCQVILLELSLASGDACLYFVDYFVPFLKSIYLYYN